MTVMKVFMDNMIGCQVVAEPCTTSQVVLGLTPLALSFVLESYTLIPLSTLLPLYKMVTDILKSYNLYSKFMS